MNIYIYKMFKELNGELEMWTRDKILSRSTRKIWKRIELLEIKNIIIKIEKHWQVG